MTAKDVRKRFTGVFGFPITPFRKDLSLDLDALERNVAGMVQHPFCALVAAGGTGELYSMTVDEIVEVVRVTVQAAGSKMPVVAGTRHNTAIRAGIPRRGGEGRAACLLAPPAGFHHAPAEEMFGSFPASRHAS